MLEDEFATPEGRKAAWRSLWMHDHGFLRKVHQNTHELPGGMFRSAQPSPGDIAKWGERGLKTIINLRGLRNHTHQPGYWYLEREACEKAGIELIDHRAYSREGPKPEFISELDQIFHKIEYPALMHCKSGADRAGLGAFLYMFLKQGASLDAAREQLSLKYGHITGGKTGILDHFIDQYAAVAECDGVSPSREHFLKWTQTEYDRDGLKKTFEPKPVGSFLTETLLRRE